VWGCRSARLSIHLSRRADARPAFVAAACAFRVDAVGLANHGEEAPWVVAQCIDEVAALQTMPLQSSGHGGRDHDRLPAVERLRRESYDLHVVVEGDGYRFAVRRSLIGKGHQAGGGNFAASGAEQALTDRGEWRILRRRGDAGANRVEVDVGHAGEQGAFVEQRLRAEAPFPEAPGAVVFAVGATGNRLVEAAHEPAQAAQALAPEPYPAVPGLALRLMARELTEMVKKMPKLDWTQRESVRATLRRNVRRLLAKYGYPPDLAESATQLVLRQAELSTENVE